MNVIPIVVLIIVFILIAVRQIGNVRLQIWHIMLLGALAVLVSGQISPLDAARSIDADVMLFLFGIFIVGQALEESGYLSHLSFRLFRRVKSYDGLIVCILFGTGISSAFLMNDTLAIIGTPVVLSLARRSNAQPRVLLLALAFAVTIGSTMSPIGNPQNLLIALHGNVANPFVTFFRFLLIPTLVNLFLAYLLLRLFYRKHFHGNPPSSSPEVIKDRKLAGLSRLSLVLLVVLVLAKVVTVSAGLEIDFRLTYIALVSALPIVLFSPNRIGTVRRIDWPTLVFFASMFILMQSVWDTGHFQRLITSTNLDMSSRGVIMTTSVLLSQVISNVPLVALYLPTLMQLGVASREMLALAVGSTIAGNLTILGAASNVIIIQAAEKRAGGTLTYLEFMRVGVPLTILNLAVYWAFLSLV